MKKDRKKETNILITVLLLLQVTWSQLQGVERLWFQLFSTLFGSLHASFCAYRISPVDINIIKVIKLNVVNIRLILFWFHQKECWRVVLIKSSLFHYFELVMLIQRIRVQILLLVLSICVCFSFWAVSTSWSVSESISCIHPLH
jgi:hypothetical protein